MRQTPQLRLETKKGLSDLRWCLVFFSSSNSHLFSNGLILKVFLKEGFRWRKLTVVPGSHWFSGTGSGPCGTSAPLILDKSTSNTIRQEPSFLLFLAYMLSETHPLQSLYTSLFTVDRLVLTELSGDVSGSQTTTNWRYNGKHGDFVGTYRNVQGILTKAEFQKSGIFQEMSPKSISWDFGIDSIFHFHLHFLYFNLWKDQTNRNYSQELQYGKSVRAHTMDYAGPLLTIWCYH